MNKLKFESLARHADFERRNSDRPDYWAGYARGLRRAYHGERFGAPGEHELWSSLIERPDHASQERGRGYLDGIATLEASERLGTPSPEAVKAFLRRHGITGSQAARMAYLSGGQAIRKYTGGANPHTMSGAVWFALHAHVMLSPEQIAEIEAAMEEDAGR